jgi:hypothetical protein
MWEQMADCFANTSFRTVANHSVADSFCDNKTATYLFATVWYTTKHYQTMCPVAALASNPLELVWSA